MVLMLDYLNQIISFIQANYWWLIVIATGVLEFLFLLIFRKDKVVDNSITFKLLPLIKQAESIFGSGNGQAKLKWVISNYKKFSPDVTDEIIKLFVEEILSTPEKKG